MSVDGALSTRAGTAGVAVSGARAQPRNAVPSDVAAASTRRSLPFMFGLHFEQQRTFFDRASWRHRDTPDDASCRGLELILHFHRFHDYETLTRTYAVTFTHIHPHYQSRHRRHEPRRTAGPLRGARQVTNRAGALVERLDRKAVAVDTDLVPAAAIFGRPARVDAMHRVPDAQHVYLARTRLIDARLHLLVCDGDAVAVQLDLDVAPAHVHVVLHRQAAGTSSQTVSTCAVWGNMSNPRSDSTR